MYFKDRRQAGKKLAKELIDYQGKEVVVFGLPRGGVPVAYEVAQALDLPLDVVAVRKLGIPGQPEVGMGVVAPEGVLKLREEIIQRLGITKEQIEEVKSKEVTELQRRLEKYRQGKVFPKLDNRTALVVDDGLATGITALGAVEYLRKKGATKIVLAVPVGARDSIDMLSDEVDELICLHAPPIFMAVGQWYREFGQTSDEEVVRLLKKAAN